MRLFLWISVVTIVALSLAGCELAGPLAVASSLTSHTLCSGVFVSKQDAARIFAEDVKPRPGIRFISWALRYHVDPAAREVTSSIGGGFASRAVYREGLGCVVVHDGGPPADIVRAIPQHSAIALPEIAGPDVVRTTNEKLKAAVDAAFTESADPPDRQTKAVVVIHDGRVIAERYARGVGVNTPLLGYSATKSVMSALIGVLVRQGKIVVDKPAPVAAWSNPADPRRAITIDNLLRMESGLDFAETNSGFDLPSRMLYLERDMAGLAESAKPKTRPGSEWDYSSANTLILSQIVRNVVGPDNMVRFAQHELFDLLGMRDVTLELDATGTPVGSTYMFAPARAWAAFGMLYLNDGVIGGHRILPTGWVRYSSTPSPHTGYGAGFWTERVGQGTSNLFDWGLPFVPGDTFFARGLLGQYVIIVPSENLVIVRLGLSHQTGRDEGDTQGVGRLVAAVVAAVHGGR
jgi:hypothetical protein